MSEAVKRRISGFCNPTLPRTEAYDPHPRCAGCDCGCHNTTPAELDWTVPKRPGWEILEAPREKVRHQIRNLTADAKCVRTYASINRDHIPPGVLMALTKAVNALNEAVDLMERGES